MTIDLDEIAAHRWVREALKLHNEARKLLEASEAKMARAEQLVGPSKVKEIRTYLMYGR